VGRDGARLCAEHEKGVYESCRLELYDVGSRLERVASHACVLEGSLRVRLGELVVCPFSAVFGGVCASSARPFSDLHLVQDQEASRGVMHPVGSDRADLWRGLCGFCGWLRSPWGLCVGASGPRLSLLRDSRELFPLFWGIEVCEQFPTLF